MRAVRQAVPERVRRPVRRALDEVVRGSAVPARAVARGVMRLSPAAERRLAGWGWLWQPGWGRRHHEEFYGREADPYGFDRKPYEIAKYDDLLAALGDRRFARGLEVGCAEGAFTERMAPLCAELVAVDISETALDRARRRLAGTRGIVLERRTLPFDFPDGIFDLIVASDIINLWEPGTVDVGLARLMDRLRPGGLLVLLHYLGQFGQPTAGSVVHDTAVRMATRRGFRHALGRTREGVGPHGAGYRLDLVGPTGEPAAH